MAGLPVSSNKLGVIQGCVAAVRRTRKPDEQTVTHLEDEPPAEIDSADCLRTIRKARRKRMLGIPRDAECGEKGDEEQCGKHWRSWQVTKEGGREKKGKGKGREGKRKSEASEEATIELGKKYVKRIGCLERSTLLSRRLKLSYQRLDKKPAMKEYKDWLFLSCLGPLAKDATATHRKQLGDLDLVPDLLTAA